MCSRRILSRAEHIEQVHITPAAPSVLFVAHLLATVRTCSVYIHTLRVSNSPPGIRAAATPHTPPPSPITTFDPCGLVSSRPAGWKSLQHVPYISMYPTSACTLHTLGSPATIAGRWGGAHQGVLARGESELGSSSSQRPADQLHGSCDASDFSAGRDAAATTTNRPTERLKGKSNASRGGGGGGVRCIYSGALVWRCTYVRDHFFVFSSIYDFPHLPCKPGTVSLPPPRSAVVLLTGRADSRYARVWLTKRSWHCELPFPSWS